jgi:hypothetical protein
MKNKVSVEKRFIAFHLSNALMSGTRVVVLQKRTEVKVEEAPIQEEVSVSQTLPHYPDDQEGKRPFFASDHFGLKCVLEFV